VNVEVARYGGRPGRDPRRSIRLLIGFGFAVLAYAALPTMSVHAQSPSQLTLYGWNPIQSKRLLPDTPLPSSRRSRVTLRATPGEVEPASFVIHSARDRSAIRIEVSDFKDSEGRGELPASIVDVRIVKAWFQAGDNFRMTKGKKTLVPELLVKDDALVRVDVAAGRQWIRTTRDGESRYEPISDPDSRIPDDVQIVDAQDLLPFSMGARESKQIWLTFRVPKFTPSGLYSGEISVESAGVEEARIPISLEILPFVLEPSRIETSLYYRGRLSPKPFEPRGWDVKKVDAYRRDIESLVEHGVLNPTFTHYDWSEPHKHLKMELAIRSESGMPRGPVYMDGLRLGKPKTPAEFAELGEKVRHYVSWFREMGYGPVYFYGIDEAKNDELAVQIPGWQLTRKLGGRVMVACYVGSAEVVGEVLDMPILAYEPDPAEARRYHEHGQRVYSYANPQVGLEDPLVYRRNYGLSIWRAGYDGSMTYAYQHAFGEIWNDFDGTKNYRDHVFAYPTDGGLVETIQYEGFREAIDDLRYLATLQKRIDETPRRSDRDRLNRWLDRIDLELDPSQVRNLIIEKILELDR
jgi:hypothetical protein